MGIFQQIREFGHRYDPIGANTVDNIVRNDSRVVAEISRGADRLFGGSTPMGRLTRDEARRNIDDPARAISRAAMTVALLYGFGAFGGGEAAAAAGGGEAVASGTTASAGMTESLMGAAVDENGVAIAAGAGGAGGAAVGAANSGSGGGTGSGVSSNPLVRSIGSAATSAAISSILAPKPEQPREEPVAAMPDPEAQAAARRRRTAQQRARQGRAASILTDQGY